MGRLSTKENKTIFQLSREELGYSREKASELLGWISPERIEKIENEKSMPHPDEILAMSIVYKIQSSAISIAQIFARLGKSTYQRLR